MSRRPTPKSLESLHVTLQKLEQTSDPNKEDASISELKQVVLNRIIDLELSNTLATEDDELATAPAPADLIPPSSIIEERTPEKGIDKTPLEKLD
jgi:hypothetical protein